MVRAGMEYGVRDDTTGQQDTWIDHTANTEVPPIKRMSTFSEWHTNQQTDRCFRNNLNWAKPIYACIEPSSTHSVQSKLNYI